MIMDDGDFSKFYGVALRLETLSLELRSNYFGMALLVNSSKVDFDFFLIPIILGNISEFYCLRCPIGIGSM